VSALVSDVRIRAEAAVLGVANGISRTVFVRLTGYDGDTAGLRVRIGEGPLGTLAGVRAWGVTADGPCPTGIHAGTLIHIKALLKSVSREAWLTVTAEAPGRVGAHRVGSTAAKRTIHLVTFINVNTSSADVQRVESPTVLTDAVSLIAIRLAECMIPTCYFLARFFTDDGGGRADVSSKTGAVVVARRVVTGGVRSAGLGHTLVYVYAH